NGIRRQAVTQVVTILSATHPRPCQSVNRTSTGVECVSLLEPPEPKETNMATATQLNTESLKSELDDLLSKICETLQISQTDHNEAEQKYQAICNWLDAENSFLRRFRPTIYPQG